MSERIPIELLEDSYAAGLDVETAAALPVTPQKRAVGGRALDLGPCPNGNIWRSSCKKRTCPVCGVRWARNQWRNMNVNLAHYGGDVVLVTVTPPGEERLPWDEERCAGRHTRGGRHSGPRGCRIESRAAREWADTASARWGAMYRAAAVFTRRNAPAPVCFLERTWEPQKRGVPHLHVVLGAGNQVDLEAAAVFVGKLKQLAPDYDFGFADARGRKKDDPRSHGKFVVVRGEPLKLVPPHAAARYLASYLTGRNKHKPGIRETVVDPAMSAIAGSTRRKAMPLVYISTRLTNINRGGTGVTMRTLRRSRHFFAAAVKRLCDPPAWVNLREAVVVGVAYARAYPKRGENGQAPPDLDQGRIMQALELADYVQARVDELPFGHQRMKAREQLQVFGSQLAAQFAGIELPEDFSVAVAA